MVEELIELGDQRLDAWITPFIQGYVEIRECALDFQEAESYYDETNPETATSAKLPDFYTIALISRRSRYRAGSRTDTLQAFFVCLFFFYLVYPRLFSSQMNKKKNTLSLFRNKKSGFLQLNKEIMKNIVKWLVNNVKPKCNN